ncbi:MAG: dihydrofolate reductase [Bacteroidetes bacterium]|jgi:dihydrofolate reductase|nr:dihydrofolate reductase [Bacteroidota bacterium]
MNITLVVAASDNNVIGKDNQLLWHLPKDMRFFKNTTWGLPILMGRKTFESLGNKVLPGRLNLILSNQKNIKTNGATLVHSLQEAVNLAAKQDYKQLMVIGGGQIYELALPLAHTIMLTRVHTTIEGDAFFPALNADWIKKESTFYNSDEKHSYSFDIECWQRK